MIGVKKFFRTYLPFAANEIKSNLAYKGAFYLFMKSPIDSAEEFCESAKKYDLLLVPSDSFGFPGYVRISYCVSPEQIENSLPAFKKLIEEYKK